MGSDELLYWPQFSERAACCLLYQVGRQDDLALGQPVEQLKWTLKTGQSFKLSSRHERVDPKG